MKSTGFTPGKSKGFTLGKSGAFTLIELLIVIAIIGILAAILFPTFAQAREKARQTSCTSNLRQIGLGIMQYVQDYDEKFPFNWVGGLWDTTPDGRLIKWMDAVYPYVKNEQVFTCPSDTGTRKSYIYYKNLKAPSSNNWGSYCTNVAYWYNSPAHSPTSDISSGQVTSLAQLARPAETVWATDGNGSFQAAWPDIATQPVISNTVPRFLGNTTSGFGVHLEGAMVERHQNRLNIVWCDGHVKSASLDMVTQKATSGPTTGAYRFLTIEDD